MSTQTLLTFSYITVAVGVVLGALGTLGANIFKSRLEEEKRVASSAPQPPPPLINWSDRFETGETVTLEVGDLPDSLRNALFIAHQRYKLRFLEEPCEWVSVGPIQHPAEGLVPEHTSRASPTLKGHLGRQDSEVSLGECNSPKKAQLVLMASPLTYDATGVVYLGRERVGRLLP